MDEQLKCLAGKYMKDVGDMCHTLFEGFGVQNKFELGRVIRERRNGEFWVNKKKYVARLHGRGCEVFDGKTYLDWDFDGEGFGINPMMLWRYIEQTAPELYEFFSLTRINEEFSKAVSNGEMIVKDDLYYLT